MFKIDAHRKKKRLIRCEEKKKVFCKYETKRTLTENKEEGTSLKTGEWLYIKHVSSANSSVVGHPGEKFYYIAGNLGRYWYSLYMLFLSLAVHPRNSASHLVRFLFITPAMCGCLTIQQHFPENDRV